MAMREIEDQVTVGFRPKDGFHLTIPERLIENDSEQEWINNLWGQFQTTAQAVCEARCYKLMTKHHRKTVFRTQMDKICGDYSRRMENLKIRFEVSPRHDQSGNVIEGKEDYQLRFVRLSPLPDFCRNVQFCMAEVPPSEAHASLVSTAADGGGVTVHPVPTAPAEILDDSAATATISAPAPIAPVIVLTESTRNVNNTTSLPMAVAKAEPVTTETSALYERLRDLEALRSFLSDTEYARTRQAILDSI